MIHLFAKEMQSNHRSGCSYSMFRLPMRKIAHRRRNRRFHFRFAMASLEVRRRSRTRWSRSYSSPHLVLAEQPRNHLSLAVKGTHRLVCNQECWTNC